MDEMQLLSEVGLTEREAKVYLALLGFDSTTTGPLTKKSGVPSSKIYEILENLHNKGLVSHIIKGKTKYFRASDPKKIVSLFKEKERKIISMIPLLESKQLQTKERNLVELFEGYKSIKGLFLELMSHAKKGETWRGFSYGVHNKEAKEFYYWLGGSKVAYGIKDKLIVSERNRRLFETNYKEDLKHMKNFLRYSNIFFPGEVGIFRDNVIILNLEEKPFAVLIKSKNLADNYTMFFDDLFESGKRITIN